MHRIRNIKILSKFSHQSLLPFNSFWMDAHKSSPSLFPAKRQDHHTKWKGMEEEEEGETHSTAT